MSAPRPLYLSMCAEEPFRLFFPLATLLGISGVSLWPLFFTGLHKFYPGIMHSRLMIQGFLGGYIIGFLGTAMPRLLSARPLRGWEVWPLCGLYLLAAGLHIGHQVFAGDIAFATVLVLFAGCLLRRVHQRAELPPPGFALVGLGYVGGLAGTLLWAFGSQGWVPGEWMMMGGAWLNQGFVLLLILGVGTFLLPRFLGLPGLVPMQEERKASPAWVRRALLSLATGLVIMGSYWLEVSEPTSRSVVVAPILRGVAVIGFLAVMVPVYKTPAPLRTVPLAVNLSLLAVVVGIVLPLFWPGQRVAALHVIFLGGFSLITFTVATRVVLGHSGNEHLFQGPLPVLRFATLLIVVATALRAVFDFLPERISGLNWASYLWMLAAVLWGCSILPKVRHPDVPSETGCRSRQKRVPAENGN